MLVLILGLTLLFTGAVSADEVLVEVDSHINTFYARIIDSNSTQLINEAQLWYAEDLLAGTEYEDYPLISAAAPFLAGVDGPDNYVSIKPGPLTQSDMERFYGFENDLYLVKIDGAMVIEWLEETARNLTEIDPTHGGDQFLVNEDAPFFYTEMMEGVEYEIDVTAPHGDRVINVTYQGDPVTEDDTFIVATNVFRATGGAGYPDYSDYVIETGDIVPDIIIDYLKAHDGQVPEPSNNWSLVATEDPAGPIMFRSSPELADYLDEVEQLQYAGEYGGWGIYMFNF